MANLKWQQGADGATSGRYRIRRVAGHPRHPWRLDIAEGPEQPASRRVLASSLHRTFRGAQAAASRAEREQGQRDRVIGHAAFGTAAFVVFVVLITLDASPAVFVASLVALYVALRSFTAVVTVALGNAWWWARDDGAPVRPDMSDRLVAAGMRWLRRRSESLDTAAPGTVHVLPPEPME